MSLYPDEQLVLEALDDSHPAFEQLIEQYQYRVLRTIASIISDDLAAHDVAQETFLSAWRDLPKLKEKQKFGGWLNQIAINLSKHWLRDQRKYQEHTASLKDMISSAQELSYQSEKLRQTVWEAIDGLTDDYREAVILYYISGYSYKEISEMLSVPVSTVRGRLQEARNQLRKEFLDMVTKLQLEIDSTIHKFLEEHAKRDGVSVEGLIIRLIERYRRDADATGAVTRRVWENALDAYAVSLNGRYVSYINWDNGNLAIHDLETGENRDVTDEGNWDKDCQFADLSVWSPDSKQIAYLWYRGSDSSLRIVGINGAKPRVLYTGYLLPRAWSRDGKHILAVHCRRTDKTHEHEIVLVSVADGSIRVLKSLDPSLKYRMSLSPDSRYVVYDYPQSKDSPERDIFALATDGSHEMALVEHPADDSDPLWSPDGSEIVFASDRSGSMGIWVLEVVDGKPKGSPRLISDNLNGIKPLGLAQGGSYYYVLPGRSNDIYFADLDPETGKVVKPLYKAIQSFEGFNYTPAFSPDGKRLVYLSQRPERRLVVRSLETGEERELQPDLPLELRSAFCWSPDGHSVLVFAKYTDSAKKMRHGFLQIHVQTGEVTPVVLNDEQGNIPPISPVWCPDGSRIFFMRNRGDGTKVIRAYDLEAEQEWSPDFRSKHGMDYNKHHLALSPDGQQLAFIGCLKDGHSFQIAPVAGGETREVIMLKKWAFTAGTRLAWTPDGRYLLYSLRLEDKAMELWRIPVEGGEPQRLDLTMKKMECFSLHPDGRRIAFTGPGSGRGSAVWVMENILPASTASR